RRRSMQIQLGAVAGVDGRDDVGLAVFDEPDVADHRLVEDRVDGGAIVGPSLREAAYAAPRRGIPPALWVPQFSQPIVSRCRCIVTRHYTSALSLLIRRTSSVVLPLSSILGGSVCV